MMRPSAGGWKNWKPSIAERPPMTLRIVMCGTGPFAVPSFSALLDAGYGIPALVTRPVDQSAQRRKVPANPMRDAALARGIPVWEPPDINAPEFIRELAALRPDLLVVCDYGQILSPECLAVARLGGINLHGSLLPRYRGAAPVAWAIWRGETVTGVSVIHMTGLLDGGPVLQTASLGIGPDESCAELEPRLAALGVDPVLRAVRQLEEWDGTSPIGTIQDPQLATRARRLRKEDSLIRWNRTARQIHNQVRALQPWPGTWTAWQRRPGEAPLRIIVARTRLEEGTPDSATAEPGQVVQTGGNGIVVKTGGGLLSLTELQPAGKRLMSAAEFLRGYPLQPGTRLG